MIYRNGSKREYCEFESSDLSAIRATTLSKFDHCLRVHIARVTERRPVDQSIQAKMGTRLSSQFTSVLDFVMGNLRRCPDFHMECSDYVIVFAKDAETNMSEMMERASKMVFELERHCRDISFANFQMQLYKWEIIFSSSVQIVNSPLWVFCNLKALKCKSIL